MQRGRSTGSLAVPEFVVDVDIAARTGKKLRPSLRVMFDEPVNGDEE